MNAAELIAEKVSTTAPAAAKRSAGGAVSDHGLFFHHTSAFGFSFFAYFYAFSTYS